MATKSCYIRQLHMLSPSFKKQDEVDINVYRFLENFQKKKCEAISGGSAIAEAITKENFKERSI